LETTLKWSGHTARDGEISRARRTRRGRRIRGAKWLAVFLLAFPALAADPDPGDVVRKALAAFEDNEKRAGNYTYILRTDHREFDGDGGIKRKRVRTHDVTVLQGSTYRRLIERDDKPLPPEEEKLEQERLRYNIEQGRKETPEQRAKRLAEEDRRMGRSRAMIAEIPKAFDFKLRGEEPVGGRPAWAIEATPKRGYRAKNAEARMILPNVKAVLWIDKADYNWVRLDAESIETISYAWLLVRIAKGARVRMEQMRVNGEVWMPRELELAGSARLGLIRRIDMRQAMTFRDYRKFQSDSVFIPAASAR
jgi:hypothetical protein